MLDYETACKSYQCSRDIYVGVKVRHGAFMKYDPTQDCFVVSEVLSSYTELPDPVPGKPRQTRYVRAPKNLWKMRPYAKIFRDRLEIINNVHANYLDIFNIHLDVDGEVYPDEFGLDAEAVDAVERHSGQKRV